MRRHHCRGPSQTSDQPARSDVAFLFAQGWAGPCRKAVPQGLSSQACTPYKTVEKRAQSRSWKTWALVLPLSLLAAQAQGGTSHKPPDPLALKVSGAKFREPDRTGGNSLHS